MDYRLQGVVDRLDGDISLVEADSKAVFRRYSGIFSLVTEEANCYQGLSIDQCFLETGYCIFSLPNRVYKSVTSTYPCFS